MTRETFADYALAICIGVSIAGALVYGWTA